MPLPSVEQYTAIIERKDPASLSTLTDHNFLYKETGFSKEYCFSIGTSAAVFKAVKNDKAYAVRCFLRGELETFKRYEQLAGFLAAKDLSWKVGFEFLENEMLIGGQYYPVVKMDWENGTPLNKFIDENIANTTQLSRLQKKLEGLSKNLEDNGIGHGDLKYNNILVQQQEQDMILKLIDYDSMFIPAFRGKKNLETGSPGFQPLKRLSSNFSETIDRFSIWVMITTLEAIKVLPDAWQSMEQGGFNNEHSLFSASDFFNPDASGIFQKLRRCNNGILNNYLDKLITFSRTSDLNNIERPSVHKDSVIPENHEKFVPQPSVTQPAQTAEQWKRHEVEIKTIPSGKDVLVYGIKKGITPLRLSLLKNDFDHVEVLHESEKTKVPVEEKNTSYEIDFSKKTKEPAPQIIEQDEILEFRPDKYNIEEGEPTTINWKVQGAGKIHISPLGDVLEKTGTQIVVLNRTTDCVLTIGSKNRSFTIQVHPRLKPAIVQPATAAIAIEETKPLTVTHPLETEKKSSSNTLLKVVVGLAILIAISFFVFTYLSKPNNNVTDRNKIVANAAPNATTFTTPAVSSFLNKLYASYNNRNLSSIMSHYATSVSTYYDSKSISNDSLSAIIKDLFITPFYYSCKPDFSTLAVKPQGNNCKATITIHEKLKSNKDGNTENYTTKIEYTLDPSYKIISEKNPL